MVLLFLSALALPALIIFFWEKLILAFSAHSIRLYRFTGLIGTPVHELAHAIGCVLFGLRITGMSLYCAANDSNVMGYVSFRFRPQSIRHQLGCLVQGVAPLIAGGAIITLVLDAQPISMAPNATLPGILDWVVTGVTATLHSFYGLATSGLSGFGLAVLLLCICLHAIPSIADITISLGGFVSLVFMGLIVSAGLYLLLDVQMSAALELHFVARAAQLVEASLWWLLSASMGVVAVAMAGSFLVVILPSLMIRFLSPLVKKA